MWKISYWDIYCTTIENVHCVMVMPVGMDATTAVQCKTAVDVEDFCVATAHVVRYITPRGILVKTVVRQSVENVNIDVDVATHHRSMTITVVDVKFLLIIGCN